MTQTPQLFHLICDYGDCDPSFNEVVQRFHELNPFNHYLPLNVPAFSTIATGFWIAQLALHRPADNIVIFSNTAPRHDDKQARQDNAGESFVIAYLTNGKVVGAVNAGYALSFIKPFIKALHTVQTSNQGSQFRSRDFFPKSFYLTVTKQIEPGEQISLDTILDLPQNRIVWIDGYGNIKTSITSKEINLKPGDKIEVTINSTTHTATYTNGIFEIEAGALTLAPGSSGDPQSPFLEIFLRRGTLDAPSAADIFNKPAVEASITLSY